jgi:hypothetical protein
MAELPTRAAECALVNRCIHGDADAREELFRRYCQPLIFLPGFQPGRTLDRMWNLGRTIVYLVSWDDRIMEDEVFGPILGAGITIFRPQRHGLAADRVEPCGWL